MKFMIGLAMGLVVIGFLLISIVMFPSISEYGSDSYKENKVIKCYDQKGHEIIGAECKVKMYSREKVKMYCLAYGVASIFIGLLILILEVIYGMKMKKEDKKKLKRIQKSRKNLTKASKNLEKQRHRRKEAEKGNTLGALFGKPKK